MQNSGGMLSSYYVIICYHVSMFMLLSRFLRCLWLWTGNDCCLHNQSSNAFALESSSPQAHAGGIKESKIVHHVHPFILLAFGKAQSSQSIFNIFQYSISISLRIPKTSSELGWIDVTEGGDQVTKPNFGV